MPLIHVDTTELTYPWFWLPGILPHFLDGSVAGGAPVDLPEGDHSFQQTRGRPSDLTFRVTAEGTVDFAARDDRLLRGRGTATLHVLGVPVTVTTGAATPPLLPMWGGCLEPIREPVHTLRMPPGTAYELRLGHVSRDILEFSVRPDGIVDYAPEYEPVLSGRGTGCLTVASSAPGRR